MSELDATAVKARILCAAATDMGFEPSIREILQYIPAMTDLKNGMSFSEAMKKYRNI